MNNYIKTRGASFVLMLLACVVVEGCDNMKPKWEPTIVYASSMEPIIKAKEIRIISGCYTGDRYSGPITITINGEQVFAGKLPTTKYSYLTGFGFHLASYMSNALRYEIILHNQEGNELACCSVDVQKSDMHLVLVGTDNGGQLTMDCEYKNPEF